MSVGAFTIIKNEAQWIGPHLMAWLPFIDQFSFFDGNSTDGTLETIRKIKNEHPLGYKIRLAEDRDCKDLQDDYVRLMDECMRALETDFAIFMHPDFFPISGADTLRSNLKDGVAYFQGMKSYGGEPGADHVYEIVRGRARAWKNIMRLRNPDIGLHYHGHYGALNEDMYFRDITGDDYEFHGPHFERYPYKVEDSGLVVAHFSDVRHYERRYKRMVSCLENQGYPPDVVERTAKAHPRVTFETRDGFVFNRVPLPESYIKAVSDFKSFQKGEPINA